jgi:hypothetical protein
VNGAPGTAALGPYEALLAHAERELELAGNGDIHQLGTMAARWEQLTAALPPRPPAAAAGLLERAALMHERTRVELLRVREAVLAELESVRRARRAAEGYAPASPLRATVDRSA